MVSSEWLAGSRESGGVSENDVMEMGEERVVRSKERGAGSEK